MSAYTIQPFSLAAYPLMRELFLAAFGLHLPEQGFRKKYHTNALGHDVIGYLAIHTATQTPAAFYGVFPVKILWQGKEVLAAQSGDTMTHPAHQKKGLFLLLAEQTFATCKAAGIALVFGQPNQNSYHGLVNRLHFTHLDEIEGYDLKRSLKTLPLARLFQRTGFMKMHQYFAKALLKKYTVPAPKEFTNAVTTSYGKLLRNEAYLQYKDEPDKLFLKIENAILWVKLSDVFWIGDVNNYEALTQSVLAKIQRLCFLLGYNTIRFQWTKSLAKPAFLHGVRPAAAEASCFLYLQEELAGLNLLLTGADFDTW